MSDTLPNPNNITVGDIVCRPEKYWEDMGAGIYCMIVGQEYEVAQVLPDGELILKNYLVIVSPERLYKKQKCPKCDVVQFNMPCPCPKVLMNMTGKFTPCVCCENCSNECHYEVFPNDRPKETT